MKNLKQLPEELNRDDLYVYSYSVTQKVGHVDMLWHDLQGNLDITLEGEVVDFKPLFIGTYDECHEYSEKLEAFLGV